jgi:hypothetical protein
MECHAVTLLLLPPLWRRQQQRQLQAMPQAHLTGHTATQQYTPSV